MDMQTVPSQGPFNRFERTVAMRYLGSMRAQGGVSLISAIAFTGIMLAVAVLIIVMSVMQGFRMKLLDQMLGLNGHVFVDLENAGPDAQTLIRDLLRQEGILSAAPLIQAPVYATTPAGEEAVLVRALHPDDFRRPDGIPGPRDVIAGSLDAFGTGRNGGNGVVLGSRLAAALGAGVGDGVTLITGARTETAFGRLPVRSKTYRVDAVYRVDNFQYDSAVIFMPYEQARIFFKGSRATTRIEVRVEEPDYPDRYLPAIRDVAGGRPVTDWTQVIGPYFEALKIERNVMRLILFLIVAVATLNIVTGLIMLVKDRTGDIAILRTMGATRGAVMRIFFLAGSFIGISGMICGVVLGGVFVLYIDGIEQILSSLFNAELFSPEIYFFENIPAVFQWQEVATIAGWSLFMSFISTLYPSWRAARLEPVEILRHL